ncbi:hypothetical protein DAPPUDRAFT_110913 [Daphnia pulex]|uniref:Hexosyltransferase n=1 Tax=Daphnia pulex TaxID=6669 RepID=E9H7K1_DAPPU|nr:hypothetical protein DAPPUDRAFT_110913 [Daphnia pulex]|eukprot:EFX72200.1 hypothetical protein DAPPUDRAFT_110913 [Daphnia pulex]
MGDNISPNGRDKIASNVLEIEKNNLPQTKESLLKQLQLLKKERRLDKARIDTLSKNLEMQKTIFEANITSESRIFQVCFSCFAQYFLSRSRKLYTRYAVACLGLLPLINVEPLKLEFGPVINDVLSLRYPITIDPCRLDVITVDQKVFVAVVNLSLKVAGIFNWLYRNCNKVDFIFKIDDDVYVNVRNLAHFVQQSHHQSNPNMFGLPSEYLSPNRDGKWGITYEEWPWSHYPTYYLGPAVLITGSAIHSLLAAFQTTPMMPFDDVYYTGICR